jgi:hypothetical protein
MDWPVLGKQDSLVENELTLFSGDDTTETADVPFPVLARFPNVGQEDADDAETKTAAGRLWLSQPFRFRLLAVAGILLVVAAVYPTIFAKKTTSTSTATAERPKWQTAVPAPNADVAPRWAATPAGSKAVSKTEEKPTVVLNNPVAVSYNPMTSGAPMPNTPAANASVADAPAPNAPAVLGSTDYAKSASTILTEVSQTASASIAKANTATQVGEPATVASTESAPLTWDHFSRQFGSQQTATSGNGKVQTNQRITPDMPRPECQTLSYPTTGTPDMLPIRPTTAATTSEQNSSGYPYRK